MQGISTPKCYTPQIPHNHCILDVYSLFGPDLFPFLTNTHVVHSPLVLVTGLSAVWDWKTTRNIILSFPNVFFFFFFVIMYPALCKNSLSMLYCWNPTSYGRKILRNLTWFRKHRAEIVVGWETSCFTFTCTCPILTLFLAYSHCHWWRQRAGEMALWPNLVVSVPLTAAPSLLQQQSLRCSTH